MRTQIRWLCAILAAAGVVWCGVYVYLTVPTVVVPRLTGLQFKSGQDIGRRAGLEIAVDDRLYHPTAQRDTVLAQDPAAGSRVRRGRRLGVTVSRGQVLVPVPALIARTMPYAWLSLDQVRLQVRVVGQRYDELTRRGAVSRQDPPPGRLVPVDSDVAVILSLGPQPDVVPDVIGLPLSDALAVLRTRGVEAFAVDHVHVGETRPGTVLGQRPAPGTRARQGSLRIRLAVEADNEAGLQAGHR